jgi:cell division protein FtsB
MALAKVINFRPMHCAILSRKLHAALAGILFVSSGLFLTSVRGDDSAVTAQLREQVEGLRQKLAGTNDPAEQAALKKEVNTLIDTSLSQISEESRPMLAVMLKVVMPLQADNSAYTRAAASFFNSPNAALETIKSREDIAARNEALATLSAANLRLLKRLDSLNGDIGHALRDSRITPTNGMAIRSTLVQQFYPTRNVRELESQIYVGFQAAMAVLDQEWGHWRVGPDGMFAWDEAATAAKFKKITDDIQRLADKQMAAQVKLMDVR